jgi:hypothetical protein
MATKIFYFISLKLWMTLRGDRKRERERERERLVFMFDVFLYACVNVCT